MVTAARQASDRLAERNALLIIMAYQHNSGASELIALRWDVIDLKAGTLMLRSCLRPRQVQCGASSILLKLKMKIRPALGAISLAMRGATGIRSEQGCWVRAALPVLEL
jgi:hypothetical protein